MTTNYRAHRIVTSLVLALALAGFAASSAWASEIDLHVASSVDTVVNGDTFEVKLSFIADNGSGMDWMLADIFLQWDPELLTYLSYQDNSPTIPSGLSALQTMDTGLVLYSIAAPIGQVLPADPAPDGTLVTTFQFQATAPPAMVPVSAPLTIIPQYVKTETIVADASYVDVTGDLGATGVVITPEPAMALMTAVGLIAVLTVARRKSH